MFLAKTSLTVLNSGSSSGVPKCGKCQLFQHCNSPKMKPHGKGRKGILIVGEAPGENEDEEGIQFVGKTGKELERVLKSHGVDMREDCWTTNAVICHPNKNATPDDKQISYCRPNLTNTIHELKPKVIILLGAVPTKSLIGKYWKKSIGGITKWAGWKIPHQELNAWICPTFHPSYIMRMDNRVLNRQFSEHLQNACKLDDRPWHDPPNDESKIKIIYDPDEAVKWLDKIEDGDTIAFDFESDRLKPDHPKSQIVCCSVCCNGKWTISFPWCGAVIAKMELILRNRKIKKIGSNIKHEHRWYLARLGMRVRGWFHDTMLMGHVLDSRPGITSIKFQAFVRLGIKDYSGHIQEYLEARGGNEQNKVKQVDPRTLLLYCGFDSYYEYLVAMDQRKEIEND
jgi:uracil-DNA glycosylase family 4